jgi:hypothetical protein
MDISTSTGLTPYNAKISPKPPKAPIRKPSRRLPMRVIERFYAMALKGPKNLPKRSCGARRKLTF